MHANSVLFSPLAVARAKLVTLGALGAFHHRIIDSVRSLKDPDHMSVAQLVKSEIARKTPSGVKCESSLRQGRLIPDELAVGMARRWFWSRRASRGFVVEGFPSTVAQATVFDEWLDGRDEALTACLLVESEESELLAEASRTRHCPKDGSRYVDELDAQIVPGHCNLCRTELVSDSDSASREVLNWFRVSRVASEAVAAHYAARGLLVRVNSAEGTVDGVLNRIAEMVVER